MQLDLALDPFALVDVRHISPDLDVHPPFPADNDSPGASIHVAVAVDSSLAGEDHAEHGVFPRLGVWYSPHLDDPNGCVGCGIPSATAGLRGPEPVVVTVRAVGGKPPVERLVLSAHASLLSPLATRNRADVVWGAASLVLAALEHACGGDPSEPGEPAASCSLRRGWAGAATTTARRSRVVSPVGRLASGALRRATMKPQWILAYRFESAEDLAPADDVVFVVPPVDRFWADPQVVFADGDYHVFYEEFLYRTGRGHIGTMRLGRNGPLDESRVALRRDCHLSYPFTFFFEGDWYMIPESAEARRIDVFRAVEFPTRWALERLSWTT